MLCNTNKQVDLTQICAADFTLHLCDILFTIKRAVWLFWRRASVSLCSCFDVLMLQVFALSSKKSAESIHWWVGLLHRQSLYALHSLGCVAHRSIKYTPCHPYTGITCQLQFPLSLFLRLIIIGGICNTDATCGLLYVSVRDWTAKVKRWSNHVWITFIIELRYNTHTLFFTTFPPPVFPSSLSAACLLLRESVCSLNLPQIESEW